MKESTAYQLGVRAHEAGGDCDPSSDVIFMTWLEEKNTPMTPAIIDYIRAFFEMRSKCTNEL